MTRSDGEPELLELVQRLAATREIEELKARYFRCVDGKDWDGLGRLFTPDATFRSRGREHRGREAVVGYIRGMLTDAVSVHRGHMPQISVHDDTARATWSMDDHAESPRRQGFAGSGRYDDEYVRVHGAWLISSSVLTRTRLEPLPPTGTAGPDTAARLALLEAERDITAVMYRYSHAIDYGLEEDWLDCFTPEGTFLRRDAKTGQDRVNGAGREELSRFIYQHSRAPNIFHKHVVLSPRISVEGATASSESYFLLLVEDEEGRPAVVTFGRYLDRWVQDGDGRWRIQERVYEAEAWDQLWSRVRTAGRAARGAAGPVMPG